MIFLDGGFCRTTASAIHPEREKDFTLDLLATSRLDCLRGPSGRLLQYDPSTDKVTVLERDLYFANGIAVAEDESYLVFVETFYSRVTKLHLQGDKKGTSEYVIDGHPSPACKLYHFILGTLNDFAISPLYSQGFDGVDCAWKQFGAKSPFCYVVGVAAVHPIAKLVSKLPQPLQVIIRTLLMIVPKKIAPRLRPYASIIILDPETSSYVGIIQDPTGKDLSTMTGITFYHGKLYLGSLHHNYIGVYGIE